MIGVYISLKVVEKTYFKFEQLLKQFILIKKKNYYKHKIFIPCTV